METQVIQMDIGGGQQQLAGPAPGQTVVLEINATGGDPSQQQQQQQDQQQTQEIVIQQQGQQQQDETVRLTGHRECHLECFLTGKSPDNSQVKMGGGGVSNYS